MRLLEALNTIAARYYFEDDNPEKQELEWKVRSRQKLSEEEMNIVRAPSSEFLGKTVIEILKEKKEADRSFDPNNLPNFKKERELSQRTKKRKKDRASRGDLQTNDMSPVDNVEVINFSSNVDLKHTDEESRNRNGSKSKVHMLHKRLVESEAMIEEQKAFADRNDAEALDEMALERVKRKAAGVKTRDDPKLIRKSLKDIKRRKVRSAKKWQERNKEVENKMSQRQKKRSDNIKKRSKKGRG